MGGRPPGPAEPHGSCLRGAQEPGSTAPAAPAPPQDVERQGWCPHSRGRARHIPHISTICGREVIHPRDAPGMKAFLGWPRSRAARGRARGPRNLEQHSASGRWKANRTPFPWRRASWRLPGGSSPWGDGATAQRTVGPSSASTSGGRPRHARRPLGSLRGSTGTSTARGRFMVARDSTRIWRPPARASAGSQRVRSASRPNPPPVPHPRVRHARHGRRGSAAEAVKNLAEVRTRAILAYPRKGARCRAILVALR